MTLYRATNKNGRVAYNPKFSESMPYNVYIDGTAGRHFNSLFDAFCYMIKKGFKF